MLALIANPLIRYALIALFLFASGAWTGYKLTSDHYQAKAATEMRLAIEEANKQAKIDTEKALAAQKSIDEQKMRDIEIRSKMRAAVAKHVELANTQVPEDVIELWNAANAGTTEIKPAEAPSKASGLKKDMDKKVADVVAKIKGKTK
jgi:hypothetical protein